MLIFHLTSCSYFMDTIFYIPEVISKFVLNVIYFSLIVFVYPKLSLSICPFVLISIFYLTYTCLVIFDCSYHRVRRCHSWAITTKYQRGGGLSNKNVLLWEVRDQGAGRFSFWWGPTSWFLECALPTHPHVVEGEESSLASFSVLLPSPNKHGYHSFWTLSCFIFPEINPLVASWPVILLAPSCTGEERNFSIQLQNYSSFFLQSHPELLHTEVTTISNFWAFPGFSHRDLFAFWWFPQQSRLFCCSVNFVTTHPSAFCLPTFCC